MGIIGRIRKYSWVAVLFVGIAILAFILGDLTKNNRQIPDVGKVDGNTMTRMRFDELVEENENNYKMQQQTTQVPSEVMSQIRESVWQNFIDETLLAEQTERMGLRVTPAEVSDMYTASSSTPTCAGNSPTRRQVSTTMPVSTLILSVSTNMTPLRACSGWSWRKRSRKTVSSRSMPV